jgi:NADPH2:quinone reductase
MRALICDEYGGIETLRIGEMPEPEIVNGSALIDVSSAAVNFADTLVVAGQYQVKPALPFVPGSEVAGTVVDVDDVPGVAPGDRVAGFLGVGAMAERAVVTAGSIFPVGDHLAFDQAAAIPVAYGTSYHALVDRARLQAGESLLVLGAAGGVGISAVQIGKALEATVVGAVSSEEKAKAVLEAGADAVVRYDQSPLREALSDAGYTGVDVVYDPVGGNMTEAALRSTNWRGRLLVIGFASGEIPRIPINLSLVKGNAIVGVFWGRFTMEEPQRSQENNNRIMAWIEDGSLRPVVQKAYPLDDAVSALRWVAERRAIGRVVVNP